MAGRREAFLKMETTSQPYLQQFSSPWHSPLPYLFGGLAVMSTLIAFALLILTFSYYMKLSAAPEPESPDIESRHARNSTAPAVYDGAVLVVMPGEARPSFLAMPSSKLRLDCSQVICGCDKSRMVAMERGGGVLG